MLRTERKGANAVKMRVRGDSEYGIRKALHRQQHFV